MVVTTEMLSALRILIQKLRRHNGSLLLLIIPVRKYRANLDVPYYTN